MARRKIDSRRKGLEWEKAVARWLRDRGVAARRSGVAGQVDGDLVTDLPFQFELKNQQDLARAIRQGLSQLDRPGVVVVKRPGKADPGEALAVMTLRDWLEVARVR